MTPRRTLTMLSTAAVALAALVALGPGGGAVQDAAAAPRAETVRVERALIAEVNRVRVRHDRRALRARATLTRSARAHAADLRARETLSHESRGGAPFWTRLVKAGYPRTRPMGENLAMTWRRGRAAARQAVRMWMRSPGHRANLLDRRFRVVGAGVAIAASARATYITVDFGG